MSAAIDIANISPFDDPRVKRRQKIQASASFKAFNAVAHRLLGDLARIYPQDATVRLLSTELGKICADKARAKTAALAFFREVRKPAKKADGGDCQYVDLLANHSEEAFREPIPVTVLHMAGISDKWSTMPEEMRDAIWEYVDRLIRLSAQAVFSSSGAVEEMNKLGRAVVGAAASGRGITPQDLVADESVRVAADEFVTSIK